MELNEYQDKAMTTCMESSKNISYMLLNLVGEVGEFSSKIAKAIRKEKMLLDQNEHYFIHWTNTPEEIVEFKQELMKEAGDILWQLSGLCNVMGWDLEDVAQMNLDKLASRQTRGVIDGNGDNR